MYSLVIPVYKNEGSIHDLLDALKTMHASLQGKLEVIFVVDGSPDNSLELLLSLLPETQIPSKVIALSRNFGSFAAIRTGLQEAQGEYFAVMAADLQEPPDLIVNFFQELDTKSCDVVIGTRDARNDPWVSKMMSNIFWYFYRKLIMPQMPVGGVDIFGCNKDFRDNLLACHEANSSLIALIFWLGFRRKTIGYVRQERKHGKSAWTLKKKIKYLMDSVFAFTDFPVRILLSLGSIGIFLSAIWGIMIFFAKITGYIPVPGYSAIMLAILFFGGLNIFGIGIVGSYVWRTYENTKQRPLTIPMKQYVFHSNQKKG
mgnify:CR=1 FL=1